MTQLAIGSGGSWKNPTGIWVGSGGAWKLVSITSVGSGGAWKTTFASDVYSGTLTAGSGSDYVGYNPTLSLGSISPTADNNGHTIGFLYTFLNTSTFVYSTTLEIASSSSLGATYFTTLTINGHSLASSSATYSYSGGYSTWTWASTQALSTTGSYPFTLT